MKKLFLYDYFVASYVIVHSGETYIRVIFTTSWDSAYKEAIGYMLDRPDLLLVALTVRFKSNG